MKKRNVLMLIVFLSLISGLWSCQWHIIEPADLGVIENVSFANDLETTFDTKCGSCHSSGTKNFTTGNVYESLINGGFVNTTDPESSIIYTKMKDDKHPSEGGTFSDSELLYLLTWIQEGANDN